MGNRSTARWLLVGIGVVTTFKTLSGCLESEDAPRSSEENEAAFTVVRSELARNEDPQIPAADQTTLAVDSAAFACDLYAELSDQPGNLVVSPHSISTALAMTFAGAAGSTAEQMADTLHFSLPTARLHAALDWLDLELGRRFDDVKLDDESPAKLQVVNSVWAQHGLSLLPGFLDTLAVNYGAGVGALDFAGDPDGSRQVINDWVDQETEHRISELIPAEAITPNVRLVLTNAIYLHAPWVHPFAPSSTRTATFTTDAEVDVLVDMMHQTESLPYLAGDGFQALSLPYAGYPSAVSLWILLPEAGRFAEFEGSLDQPRLAAIAEGLVATRVAVSLPKFHILTKLVLSDTLEAMGMTLPFSSEADFSAMCTEPLHITDVYHDADITVDEAGTEAAAATAVLMGDAGVALPIEGTVEFVADQPFFFVLRDDATGAVLFMGRVTDPQQQSS
jgi:serpin B